MRFIEFTKVVCKYALMHRITLSMPEDLADLLKREAHKKRESVSKVACRAIDRYLRGDATQPTELPFAGIGGSGLRHTARDAEKILAADWGDDRDH